MPACIEESISLRSYLQGHPVYNPLMSTWISKRPDWRIVWLKHCRHNLERCSHMKRSLVFPMEIILLIRQHIKDGVTLCAFDRAFHILPCTKQFCNQILHELWFEKHDDVLSIGENELNKQRDRPPFSIRHQPAFYCITRTEYGLNMILLKHHPLSYRYFLHHSIYEDPLTGLRDFIAVNSFQIQRPTNILPNSYFCNSPKPMYSILKRGYYQIEKWFDNTSKSYYPGWDPEQHSSNRYRGKCWIYPEGSTITGQKTIWNFLLHHPTPSLLQSRHYWEKIKEPCIEWTQILFDLRQFQNKIYTQSHYRR